VIEVGPPTEHVVIFDEAQRAWNLKQTASFIAAKETSGWLADSNPIPDFLHG